MGNMRRCLRNLDGQQSSGPGTYSSLQILLSDFTGPLSSTSKDDCQRRPISEDEVLGDRGGSNLRKNILASGYRRRCPVRTIVDLDFVEERDNFYNISWVEINSMLNDIETETNRLLTSYNNKYNNTSIRVNGRRRFLSRFGSAGSQDKHKARDTQGE